MPGGARHPPLTPPKGRRKSELNPIAPLPLGEAGVRVSTSTSRVSVILQLLKKSGNSTMYLHQADMWAWLILRMTLILMNDLQS